MASSDLRNKVLSYLDEYGWVIEKENKDSTSFSREGIPYLLTLSEDKVVIDYYRVMPNTEHLFRHKEIPLIDELHVDTFNLALLLLERLRNRVPLVRGKRQGTTRSACQR